MTSSAQLVLITGLTFLFTFVDKCIQRPAISAELPAPNAEKFLIQFGYMRPTKAMLMSSASVSNATAIEISEMADFAESIRDFQAFVGLPPTGIVDAETLAKMNSKRCGMPDRNIGGALGNLRMMSAAITSMYVWKKTRLSFFVEKYSSKLNPIEQRRAITKAFDVWSSYSALEFVETTIEQDADIHISFRKRFHDDQYPFDGPGIVLAHAFFPPNGQAHFDEDENWIYSKERRSSRDIFSRNDGVDLYSVAVHEFGHLLGLDHSSNQNSIMAPHYNPDQEDPQLDSEDIKNIQSLYGPPQHPKPSSTEDSSSEIFTTPMIVETVTTTSKPTTKRFTTTISSEDTKIWTLPLPRDKPSTDPWNRCSESLLSSITAIVEGLGNDQRVFVFSGSVLRIFDRVGFSTEKDIDAVFSPGPSVVTAAIANRITQTLLLLQGRNVWVYDYRDAEYQLWPGMPIKLPENIPMEPRIAFQWIDGNQVFIEDNVFYTYDEAHNVRTFIGSTKDYFPNIPAKTKYAFNIDDKLHFYDGRFLDYDSTRKVVQRAEDSIFQCRSTTTDGKKRSENPTAMFLIRSNCANLRISLALIAISLFSLNYFTLLL